MMRIPFPRHLLGAAAIGSAGVLFLLMACGFVPAHLTHDHGSAGDDTHQSCDICPKIAANPALVADGAAIPDPAGSESHVGGPVPRILPVQRTIPRGRAPPSQVPIS